MTSVTGAGPRCTSIISRGEFHYDAWQTYTGIILSQMLQSLWQGDKNINLNRINW